MSNNENLTVWQRLSATFGPNSLLNQDIPTYKFDKKELLRTQNKVEFEREKLQAQQSFYLSNQWAKIDNHLYTQAVYYEPTRLASVYDFESMEYTPEIGAALDIYAEESTTSNEDGHMLQIYSESKRIKSVLTDLFNNILDINTSLPMWTRNTPIREDSIIPLLDGTEVTIKELSERIKKGEEVWTYSIQQGTTAIVCSKIIWCDLTRENSELVRVTFDDGTYIDTTPDHEYMLRNGSFMRADLLKPNQSLMPFYTKKSEKSKDKIADYEKVYNPNTGKYKFTHRMVAHEYVRNLEYENSINENFDTHHIDFRKNNNNPNNLIRLRRSEHFELHIKHYDKILGTPEVIKKRIEGSIKYLKSDSRRERMSNEMKGIYPKYFEEYNNSELHSKHNEIRSLGMLRNWSSSTFIEKTKKGMTIHLNDKCISHITNIILNSNKFIGINELSLTLKKDNEFINLFKETYTLNKNPLKSINPTTLNKLFFRKLNKNYFEFVLSINPNLSLDKKFIKAKSIHLGKTRDITILNHKVVSVTKLEETSNVYCLEAVGPNGEHDRHNFAVCSKDINGNHTRNGVFLANCKFGDNFVFLKLDPEKGIVGCNQLPNIEIERLEPGSAEKASGYGELSSENDSLKFKWKNKQMEFQPWEIAHFRILGDDRKLPYGTSLLEKARRIWKQLLLSEDAMLIYRTSRAPERRVFKVFVGNMDDNDVEAYVQRVANKFKREQIVDSKTGNVDMRYNQMAVDQDYFVPVRDPGQASPIETLAGACISLDTRIPLLDGRVLELSKLIEEWDNGNRNLWAYSCDPHTGDLAPGLITWAGVTRKDTNVLKITLDNGEEVITTPDHKFVHRTNGFVEAQNLKVGDSLMPFYSRESQINKSKSKYHQVWNNKTKKWNFTHRIVANFMKVLNQHVEFVYNDNFILEDKKTIHHLDINRYNNTPSNLVFMNNRDHYGYHSDNINIEHCKLGGQALKNKLIENPKLKEELAIRASINSKKMWSKRSVEDIEIISEKQSNGLKKYIQNLTEGEKKDRFSKNIHTPQAKSKTLISLLSWCKDIDNLKKKGALISATKQLYENKLKSSQLAKKNWESPYYRDKVFSKPQKLIFNDLLFNIFVEKTKQYNKVNEIITSLNNDENFMIEFSNLNNGIRSSLVNLTVFTHNNLNKLLNAFGYTNWKSWKGREYNNHKIVSIEIMEERMDTGTITIDGNEIYHNYHTFAIESGIFIKNSNLGEIADIEYIQKKLVTALRIPKTFLGFEDVVGDGKTLSLQDIRFARTINRIQKCMISELNKIAIIHLFLLGFEDEISNFTLGLTNPSTQSDLLKIDIWKEKIGLYRDAVADPGTGIAPVSATWAKKHIFGFSDEEIRLDLQQQRIEKAVGEELKQTPLIIKKTGLFDNIDKLYGSVSGGTASAGATPPPPDDMGGMDMGGMDMGGMDMGAPPPPPPPPGGGEMPPPGEPGLAPESRFDKLNILAENSKINGLNYSPFTKGQKSLGDLENELKKLLG